MVKEELTERQNGKLILGGDLNLMRKIEETFCGKYHSDSSREAFEEIMEQHNLIDIPPSNGMCTWINKRIGKNNIKERLDRILIHKSIAATFTLVKRNIVHTIASNHKPMVLSLGTLENQGLLPLRYNSIWDSKEEFGKQNKDSWKKCVTGSP